ncbi:MAG: hypothetical protein A3D44_02405 [Candidatus Staskawiczbacteria bacterium RIFCSPHIGHO2_02_FULL_42_22]|uniref:N-acetylmuramoyl-L-alanine amidase domain-containing protein n=1 Tax=Candidatus Staskawiczbacteria bacterium RIFCSPHIGHO2_02_FULL_42_22 TaxID=1802207 RepID=A0A1G2I3G4_9BACT|nr:MAG: hypothetical protein A3D44_02405 [Candidatus Staskawiczbacteria bacterium RIFCSPHIGHO2_02_FULL_42_22]
MNRIVPLVALFSGLFFAGVAIGDESTKPPEVKRGEPIVFKMVDYDVKEWQAKTKTGAAPWFKVDVKKGSWYVDWDAQRQPFDTIVIHHSDTKPDTIPADIDSGQKERLYAPRYRSADDDPYVKGLTIHSGHIVDGKEKYIGYHHLVYADGKVTTELSPLVKIDGKWFVDHVAWHAGKWSVNCRSVAICLVGNFSEEYEEDGKKKIREPSDAQLRATAGLIVHYRTFNSKATVTSHGDHAKTECPGKTWYLWKKKITKE